jgi:hypothetical protein
MEKVVNITIWLAQKNKWIGSGVNLKMVVERNLSDPPRNHIQGMQSIDIIAVHLSCLLFLLIWTGLYPAPRMDLSDSALGSTC